MKPFVLIVTALLSLLLLQEVSAQKAKPKAASARTTKPAVAFTEVALGRPGVNGGTISKRSFDSLAAKGLLLPGGQGTILSFQFIYAERNLYEDSLGNPLLTTDYLSEYCFGDTLSPAIRENLYERTKPGDTAYFDQIKISSPKGTGLRGKPMRFVLQP